MSTFVRSLQRASRIPQLRTQTIQSPVLTLARRWNSTGEHVAEKDSSELSNYERIRHDLKAAMKERDMKTLNPLKTLLASLQKAVKEQSIKNPDLQQHHFESDLFLAPVIHRQLTIRQEAIVGFKEHRRSDLVEKEEFEMSVLKKYLPHEPTTEEQVRSMTIEAIETMRSTGEGANDPASQSPQRIYVYLTRDPTRRDLLSPVRAEQGMVRRVIAATMKELSDRPDRIPDLEPENLKPREEDTLTHPRYQ